MSVLKFLITHSLLVFTAVKVCFFSCVLHLFNVKLHYALDNVGRC